MIALAPLLTDPPLLLVSLTILHAVPAAVVHVLYAVGGLVAIGFGIAVMRAGAPHEFMSVPPAPPQSPGSQLIRGITMNLANPAPILFWTTVAAPILTTALQRGRNLGVGLFVAGFFFALVGTKVMLAIGVARGSRFLGPRTLKTVVLFAGLTLIAVGCFSLRGALLRH